MGWASSATRHKRVEPLARRGGGRPASRLGPKRAAGVAELAARAVEPAAQRARQPLGELVEPLLLGREQRLALGPVAEQRLELLARPARAPGARSARRGAPSSRTWASSSLRTGTAISAAAVGVGARTSAAKSHRRGVGLVADRGDDRDRRAGDGADHLLLVERPQILDRAAAARDDQQVGRRRASALKPATAAAILLGRALALDRHRPER